MNNAQKVTVIVGILIIVGMFIYPPWNVQQGGSANYVTGTYSPVYKVSGEYGLLFDPPHNSDGITVSRLAIQCGAVALLTLGLALAVGTKKKA